MQDSFTERISGEAFRKVMAVFPTGVVVVAGCSNGVPAGLSINSFMSVSLDPPLVGFCVAKGSTSWAAIEESGSFCVNILAEDQAHMSTNFARRADDKFANIAWQSAKSGSPVLPEVLAWIDCAVHEQYEAGDHRFILGKVADMAIERAVPPLLFHESCYGRIMRPGESHSQLKRAG